uniref:Uncharacterized protein n=1 Tax=Peronospora matthiolae TaxID=2874970 RepID=A0AAV1UMV4_9STRA
MQIFNWDNENDVFVATIASLVMFRLTIKVIAVGMSFKQTALGSQGGDKMW